MARSMPGASDEPLMRATGPYVHGEKVLMLVKQVRGIAVSEKGSSLSTGSPA